jgi:hypothetical protein
VKKPKPWRLVKDWHPNEWATFTEAWQRVEAAVGSSLWLIQHDLHRDFLEKRLIAAARRIASDGTETLIIFKPEYWQQLKINYAWSIEGWEAEAREGERWVFVVRRHELDKRYPIATPGRPAPDPKPSAAPNTPGEAEDAQSAQKRRKPGPPPSKDWRSEVVRELIKRAKDGEELPSAPEMCKFCGQHLELEPDLREMQRLLSLFADPRLWRLLIAALR